MPLVEEAHLISHHTVSCVELSFSCTCYTHHKLDLSESALADCAPFFQQLYYDASSKIVFALASACVSFCEEGTSPLFALLMKSQDLMDHPQEKKVLQDLLATHLTEPHPCLAV